MTLGPKARNHLICDNNTASRAHVPKPLHEDQQSRACSKGQESVLPRTANPHVQDGEPQQQRKRECPTRNHPNDAVLGERQKHRDRWQGGSKRDFRPKQLVLSALEDSAPSVG